MFTQQRSLSVHLKQVHDKSNHIKCDECSYTTFQPYMLKKHKLSKHTKSTKYECDLCSYSSFSHKYLRTHKMRVHCKTKAFVCDMCDKQFDKKDNYAKHLLQNHNIVYQYKS